MMHTAIPYGILYIDVYYNINMLLNALKMCWDLWVEPYDVMVTLDILYTVLYSEGIGYALLQL